MPQAQPARRCGERGLQAAADGALAEDVQRAAQLMRDDHGIEVATQGQLPAELEVCALAAIGVAIGAACLCRCQCLQRGGAVGAQRHVHVPVHCQLQGVGGGEVDLPATVHPYRVDACSHGQLERLQSQLALLQRDTKTERVDEQWLRVGGQIENGIAGVQLSDRESAIQWQREWERQRVERRLHTFGNRLHGFRQDTRQRFCGGWRDLLGAVPAYPQAIQSKGIQCDLSGE